MTTSPLPPQIIVDIKARRNDATERTNKRMNERVRQADGQTDGWTNERRCKRTYVRRPGEQNASADLVAYLWLRYPVVNKVPHGRDIGVYLRAVGAVPTRAHRIPSSGNGKNLTESVNAAHWLGNSGYPLHRAERGPYCAIKSNQRRRCLAARRVSRPFVIPFSLGILRAKQAEQGGGTIKITSSSSLLSSPLKTFKLQVCSFHFPGNISRGCRISHTKLTEESTLAALGGETKTSPILPFILLPAHSIIRFLPLLLMVTRNKQNCLGYSFSCRCRWYSGRNTKSQEAFFCLVILTFIEEPCKSKFLLLNDNFLILLLLIKVSS
ncbi:hypothetical protein ALC53_11703 [Atta colombica]|uniref:Uncharacterized protein n=1 Tax=Atta colombica TaxID=520822 RepID=A0A195AZN2_9HYME|nr:hypothetical protein ALC53_11703 [Atta colombica]